MISKRHHWLIFDPRTKMWWGPAKMGRYPDILNAGLYTITEVKEIMVQVKKDPLNVEVAIRLEEYSREIQRLSRALWKGGYK